MVAGGDLGVVEVRGILEEVSVAAERSDVAGDVPSTTRCSRGQGNGGGHRLWIPRRSGLRTARVDGLPLAR
jgi:hypothetical protein